MFCERCGVSSEKARLLDVISPEGIIKLCESCADAEDFPVLKRPTTAQLIEAEKPAYYGRYAMGANTKETSRRIEGFGKPVYSAEGVDVKLRDIVDKNYKEKISADVTKGPRADMVDNFHWIIMRARRAKKITQKELAREISEAEAAIAMAEKGILPEDDYKLVRKIEAFLGVKLIKDETRKKLANREMPARILKIDEESMKNLTIDDLRRMKREKDRAASGEDNVESEETAAVEPEQHDYQEEIEVLDDGFS